MFFKINKPKSIKLFNSLVLAFTIFSCSTNQINNVPITITTPNYKNKVNNLFKIKYAPEFNPTAYYLAYDDVRNAIKNKSIPDALYHYFYSQKF